MATSPTQGDLVLSPLRQQLLEILRTKALRRLDEPLQLASGEWSSDFIDGKEALAHWDDLLTASRAIVETVTEAGHSFDAAGGLTLGADALAVGISAAANCRWFIVRKEPKARGTRRHIEGAQIGQSDQVVLVDDVVTSGGSILKAFNLVTETGANVVAAVTLVDRSNLAAPKFDELGVDYFPMATYEMLDIAPVGLGPVSTAR